MKQLSETWFAEGFIDFELKKYTLLAYLQEIQHHFGEQRLYPLLSDLIFHYNNLVSFRENKKFLQEHFPKRLTGMQMAKLETLYEQLVTDDELMQELESIIHFSAGEMKSTISSGAQIYEWVEEHLTITPVGLIPLDVREGYFFLRSGASRTPGVYHYRMSIFEKHDERYRSMKTEWVGQVTASPFYTYEQMKTDLIRQQSGPAHPAVYCIETPLKVPVEETLLPVAKRSLVKIISSAES